MRLIPIVVLIEQDDLDTMQEAVDRLAVNFADTPTKTAMVMNMNGWTPEMLAWSLIFRGIASAKREGLLEFELANMTVGDDG